MTYARILVINLGGIGDMLLSTPALRSLRQLYPEARISMLTTKKAGEIVKDLPYIDRVYTFELHYGGGIPLWRVFHNAMVLFFLRMKNFGLAINMRTLVSKEGAARMRFLLKCINPKKSAGRDTENRGTFFDVRFFETQQGQKYEMDYDIDMIRLLGGGAVQRQIDFFIKKSDEEKVSGLLRNAGISEKECLIGIHPGGMPSRRWPRENFSRLISLLLKDGNCRIVISGGKDERELAEYLRKVNSERVISLADKLTLKELGALIERCALFISNDTGPMHIAAVLKTPQIALFGPGDITRFDPRNISDNAVVFYEKSVCAPCEKVKCDDMECLKQITPGEVTHEALKLLTQVLRDKSERR
ncbi:MAG: glycosyltransferase family 9 protein [Candidatus Omnitrophica bacterium]|nr:glycosyltransferase family 9 protein [Candidatus Omnitrophota bacterium]MBU4477817.1 glycosyltransferase family 9 protein [Candidatus Omnitrophota bacterium]MCG2703547.1 glycosyltransferase family 9 protein [Candidatus Omnitrophota bacterium]